MIQKVVNIINLKDPSAKKRDLSYWLSKTPEERVSAVEFLRRQYYGSSVRLQRVARVVKRAEARTQNSS